MTLRSARFRRRMTEKLHPAFFQPVEVHFFPFFFARTEKVYYLCTPIREMYRIKWWM